MAKMTSDELLGVFEEMTVLELKDFLDAFEEKFDVSAAAPVAVAAAPCVHINTLLSPPVCVQSKSEPATSPVAPTAKVAKLLSPVAL